MHSNDSVVGWLLLMERAKDEVHYQRPATNQYHSHAMKTSSPQC